MNRQHLGECQCEKCKGWFAMHSSRTWLTGKCAGCGIPVDDHQLSVNGVILKCPKVKT